MKKEQPPKMTDAAKKWLKRRFEQREKYKAEMAKKALLKNVELTGVLAKNDPKNRQNGA